MPEDKRKKAILAGAIAAALAGIGIGVAYAAKKPEGEPISGEIQGTSTIEVIGHSPEETAELVESGEVVVVQSFTPPSGMIVRSQYEAWKITLDGITLENVASVEFRPKIRHLSGGEFPIDVSVDFYVNGEKKATVTGQLTSQGQEITLQSILWIPSAEGTYDLLFVATATDRGGRTGTAQAGYTANVELVVAPPEIEIEVEVVGA